MISQKVLELFNKGRKKYYSLQELVNYTKAKKEVLKVVLSRLSSQKKIIRLGHGFYSGTLEGLDFEQLACQLVFPSYLSFEYALYLHGIYAQVPATITLATTKKTKTIELAENTLEYSHLSRKMFFGYEISKNANIAFPEKALLDELYLVGLRKRSINLEELDLSKINRKKIKEWLPLYPPSTIKLLKIILK